MKTSIPLLGTLSGDPANPGFYSIEPLGPAVQFDANGGASATEQTIQPVEITLHPLTAVREVRRRLERERSNLISFHDGPQPASDDDHFTVAHTGTHLAAMKVVVEGLDNDLDALDKAKVLAAIEVVAQCAKRLNRTARLRGQEAAARRHAEERLIYRFLIRFIANDLDLSPTPLVLAVQLARENARNQGRGYRDKAHSWRRSDRAFRIFLKRLDRGLALLDHVEARLISERIVGDSYGPQRPSIVPGTEAKPRKRPTPLQLKAGKLIVQHGIVKSARLSVLLKTKTNISQKVTTPLQPWGLVKVDDGWTFPPDAAFHQLLQT